MCLGVWIAVAMLAAMGLSFVVIVVRMVPFLMLEVKARRGKATPSDLAKLEGWLR